MDAETAVKQLEALVRCLRELYDDDAMEIVHPGTTKDNVRVDFTAPAWDALTRALDTLYALDLPACLEAIRREADDSYATWRKRIMGED